MMNREENSDSIPFPTDLFFEIFSRLPAKSIGKFRCVSKEWNSILDNPDFTDLFFTKSSARPRLLFGVKPIGECYFFSSSSQPKSSSLDFHTKFVSEFICSYGCGLIYLRKIWIEKENKEAERVICNPITGQYTILPELEADLHSYGYLGFDPIDKQFKLLVMNTRQYIAYSDSVHHILTLGSGNMMKWRNVQCPFTHEPFRERICINGVLYYLAQSDGYPCPYMIVCFDVRSEEFKFIDTERFCNIYTKLVNYKGKLSAVNYDSGMRNINLRMWVLEDVEKQEWSKFVYTLTLPENEVVDSCRLSVVGVTASGEIVLCKQFTCKPFYVFYFNPERNTLQRVEIHGNHQVFENKSSVFAFVDHVEDLKFDLTCAATTINPPEQTSRSTSKDHQLVDESKDDSLNLTLEQTMKSSRLKNEKVITEKVAKASIYKEADKSCKVISGRPSRGSGCLKGTAITAVVVAAAGAVAAVVLSSNPEATTELINLVDSYVNVIITALKN